MKLRPQTDNRLIWKFIRQGHCPKTWKMAKSIMLQKPNKLDYTTVKSYQAISLLNSLGEMCEKVVANILAELGEVHHVLHKGQMGFRK